MAKLTSTLMSHEDRRKLIELPIPRVRVLTGDNARWSGILISGAVPEEGRRVMPTLETEEAFYNAMTREDN